MKDNQVVYLTLLAITFCLGIYRWRQLNSSDRIIAVLIALTLVQEIVAFVGYWFWRHNLFTYHFYSPIEFFIICYYFNSNSAILVKRNWGILLGVFGIGVAIVNTLFFQPITVFNSYYLIFEATFIIILCLLSLAEQLLDDSVHLKSTQFMITVVLLLYWSLTYIGWGVFERLVSGWLLRISKVLLQLTNYIFYASIAIIFLRYHKLNRSGN